jgi:opacity protein-like surface antigen
MKNIKIAYMKISLIVKSVRLVLATILMLNFTLTAQAQDSTDNNYPMLNLTAGIIGVLDGSPKNANLFGIEYRAKSFSKWGLVPAYGYTWSVNDTQYVYADLKHDFNFLNNWVFTLSLGTGLFDNSDDLDLGHAIEFRSGFEFTYRFKNNYRLGLTAYHLSNSKIAQKNPGTESIVVSLLIPLDKIFNK